MYREEDIEQIKLNIDFIKEQAMIKYKTENEPTFEESTNVYNALLEFIKKKKRIIYGGYAQNLLIKTKNHVDAFYKETDTPDIEFYSFEPIKDSIELCDYLYEKKFKYIQASEGVHPGTYKIFINFINYCDISYLSKNIYDHCPIISINGLSLSHPHFMIIDSYRVFTDPMTSYWRLDKVFNRYLKLIKYYPFEKQQNKMPHIINNDLKKIRKLIIHNSKYIVIGFYAFNYYIRKIKSNYINVPFYELISIDFENDAINIYKKLKKIYKNTITTKEFTPFYEFFDRRIEYYHNDNLILKLYGNNSRCIFYRYSEKKKTYFGTNQIIFLYLLSNYYYHIINNNKLSYIYYYMLYNLQQSKNKYLNDNNKKVLDTTPFEDFTYKCIGMPVDTIRKSMLEIDNKKKKGLKLKFRYEPKGTSGTLPDYKFENNSGNQILNEKYLVLKNN